MAHHPLTEWTGLRIHLFPLVSLPSSLTPCQLTLISDPVDHLSVFLFGDREREQQTRRKGPITILWASLNCLQINGHGSQILLQNQQRNNRRRASFQWANNHGGLWGMCFLPLNGKVCYSWELLW